MKFKNRKLIEGKSQHVFPVDGGWAVRGEWNLRITFKTRNKEDAIKKAKEIATNQKVNLFVHNKKGKISKIKIEQPFREEKSMLDRSKMIPFFTDEDRFRNLTSGY